MNEIQMQQWLMELMFDAIDERCDADEVDGDGGFNLRTFDEAGLLNRNKGLVLRMPDGSEFQLTIVKAR